MTFEKSSGTKDDAGCFGGRVVDTDDEMKKAGGLFLWLRWRAALADGRNGLGEEDETKLLKCMVWCSLSRHFFVTVLDKSGLSARNWTGGENLK